MQVRLQSTDGKTGHITIILDIPLRLDEGIVRGRELALSLDHQLVRQAANSVQQLDQTTDNSGELLKLHRQCGHLHGQILAELYPDVKGISSFSVISSSVWQSHEGTPLPDEYSARQRPNKVGGNMFRHLVADKLGCSTPLSSWTSTPRPRSLLD